MSQLDRISLIGLRAHGRHGVLRRERENGQEFIIDACLYLNTRPAAAADDLSLTVDYGVLADRIAEVVAGDPVDLIETLAERLVAVCLDDERVSEVEVTVHKPSAPVRAALDDVTVTLRRSRR